MKKNLFILSLIVALAASFTSKAVFAGGAQGSGGIVAVLVTVIDDENKTSVDEAPAPKVMEKKSEKSKDAAPSTEKGKAKGKGKTKKKSTKNGAFNTNSLKEEFTALNNSPESLKLIQQSAGGSADLKALLASN